MLGAVHRMPAISPSDCHPAIRTAAHHHLRKFAPSGKHRAHLEARGSLGARGATGGRHVLGAEGALR